MIFTSDGAGVEPSPSTSFSKTEATAGVPVDADVILSSDSTGVAKER